jgi:hypothetical protein
MEEITQVALLEVFLSFNRWALPIAIILRPIRGCAVSETYNEALCKG